MSKERILISGASGFIGRNLTQHLQSNLICILTRSPETYNESSFTVLNCSVLDDDLSQKIKCFNPTIIIHLAGDSSMSRDLYSIDRLIQANVYFGVFLLEVASNCSTHTFINTTSSLIFEQEKISLKSLYACSKKSFIDFATYYSSLSTIRIIHVVLYNVYGRGDEKMRAINYVIKSLDTPVAMSPGMQELDLIHIDDVVNFFISLIQKISEFKSNSYFYVGTSVPTSLRKLANCVEEITQKKCQIEWGAISYRENEVMSNVAPKIVYDFWRPKIELKQGLKKMM